MASNGFEFKRGRVGTVDEEELADELLCNGLVKPLKLPPRMVVTRSPSPSWTQKSYSGGLKLSFRTMWAETDSDPFQKAAEKVRERESKSRKSMWFGSGSVSPLGVGTHQWTINDLNMSDELKSCKWSQKKANSTTINRRDEPRGIAIARKLRPLISMEQGNDARMEVRRPLSPVKESKHRFKGLLNRRKGSKSGGKASENEEKRTEISDVKTVVQYRPRPNMLLCLRFQKVC